MIRAVLDAVSLWAIPVMLVGIPLVGLIRGVKVYDVFIEGATEGFQVAVRIIPFLVGILVAIGMFRGSGAMDLLIAGLRPLLVRDPLPRRTAAACRPSIADRQWIARVRNRRHQDAWSRLGHRAHRGDNVRFVRNNVLRAGCLLRRGQCSSHAACRACGTRRRRGRSDRGGGGVRVALLIAGSSQLSDFSCQTSAQRTATGFRLPASSCQHSFGLWRFASLQLPVASHPCESRDASGNDSRVGVQATK